MKGSMAASNSKDTVAPQCILYIAESHAAGPPYTHSFTVSYAASTVKSGGRMVGNGSFEQGVDQRSSKNFSYGPWYVRLCSNGHTNPHNITQNHTFLHPFCPSTCVVDVYTQLGGQ